MIEWIDILNDYCQDESIDRAQRKQKAIEIGEEINAKGGFQLMLQVHDNIKRTEKRPGAARLIEYWWDCIGEWRG